MKCLNLKSSELSDWHCLSTVVKKENKTTTVNFRFWGWRKKIHLTFEVVIYVAMANLSSFFLAKNITKVLLHEIFIILLVGYLSKGT